MEIVKAELGFDSFERYRSWKEGGYGYDLRVVLWSNGKHYLDNRHRNPGVDGSHTCESHGICGRHSAVHRNRDVQ